MIFDQAKDGKTEFGHTQIKTFFDFEISDQLLSRSLLCLEYD